MKIIPFPSRAQGADLLVTQNPGPDDRPMEEATEMEIARQPAPRHMSDELSRQIASIFGPCIDCADCSGACMDLVDALMVPDAVLGRASRRRDGD